MPADFVIPKNNESDFVDIAARLGINKIYFLYESDHYDEEKIQRKIQLIENKKVITGIGLIANAKNLNKSYKKSNLTVAKSSDDDRILIESKKIKMIYGFEESGRKDYIHQRASGLNHIMCELASKNNVTVGFSYNSLFGKNNLILGRMKQNIKLCQKYKVKTAIGAFTSNPFELRSPYDISSLFRILGINIPKNKSF